MVEENEHPSETLKTEPPQVLNLGRSFLSRLLARQEAQHEKSPLPFG